MALRAPPDPDPWWDEVVDIPRVFFAAVRFRFFFSPLFRGSVSVSVARRGERSRACCARRCRVSRPLCLCLGMLCCAPGLGQ